MGPIFRNLVLGILWISVAAFGLCGAIDLVNSLGRSHSGGENFSGIAAAVSGVALVILLPLIALIRWLWPAAKAKAGDKP